MKHLILYTCLSFGSLSVFAQIDRSVKPAPAPAKEIKIGDYEKFTLKNGLTVIVVENHKIPRVAFSLTIDRDPVLENDKVGYLSMAGQMLRRGTTNMTKAQLDEEIDFIGASLFTSATSVFGASLTKHQDKLLDLMTDVLYNPAFPEEELEKIKTQTISGIKSNQDDPNAISGNVRSVLLYGKDHPYGEIQLEEHVANISIGDIRNYYDTYFKPNISYLTIVGDITPKEAKKIAKARFGSWEGGEVPSVSHSQPKAPEKTYVALVNRSNSVQTVLNITYPIQLRPGEPDVIKSRVMNQVLGGGSAARLFKNIREDKGFTYGAYSSLSSDEWVGSFNASASVRTEVTDSSTTEFLYEMDRISEELVPEEELQLAKNVIIGGFGRSLENAQTIASFALNLERYNLPEDYYNSYVQKVQAVTSEDVQAMANKFISPENAHIVAVGKVAEIKDGMAQFGEVKHYDIYGSEVDPAMASLPDGLTAGSVLSKYKEALGGEEAISKIENVTMNMSASTMSQVLALEQVLAKGMKSRTVVSMGGMTVMSSVSDGERASASQMGRPTPLDEATTEEQIITSALFSELMLEEMGATLSLSGVETIGGKEAYGVEVTLPKGGTYTLYFEAESGLKVRYLKVRETPRGPVTQIVDYGDYKEVEGIMIPYELKQQVGPQNIDCKVEEVLINQSLSDETFKVE